MRHGPSIASAPRICRTSLSQERTPSPLGATAKWYRCVLVFYGDHGSREGLGPGTCRLPSGPVAAHVTGRIQGPLTWARFCPMARIQEKTTHLLKDFTLRAPLLGERAYL